MPKLLLLSSLSSLTLNLHIPGFFQHGHTYVGHPVACAAGAAVVKAMLNRGLIDRVKVQGEKLKRRLDAQFGDHSHIGDIRGRGLFLGMEIVQDRNSKAAFASSLGINKRFKAAAFEAGLICYSMGGTIDGKNGDHVLLAPPFIIKDDHIEEIVSKLDVALEATLASA